MKNYIENNQIIKDPYYNITTGDLVLQDFIDHKEDLKPYLNKNSPLKLNQPYLDPYYFDRYCTRDHKEKWLSKKGFIYKKPENLKESSITNYVNVSHGVRFNDFIFRERDKTKFLVKNGFICKNGVDYLLKIDKV